MSSSISGTSITTSYYIPQDGQRLSAVRDIPNPIDYFENAEENYSVNEDSLSIEMMSNAIQAYIKQSPEAVDAALALVDRLPPDCLQRNESIMAILEACSDVEKKKEIIDRLTYFQYYTLAVRDLFSNNNLRERVEIVLNKFPECRNSPEDMESIYIFNSPE